MRSGRRRFRQLRGGLLVPCAGARYTTFLLVGLEWTSAGGLGHGLGPDLLFLEGRTEEEVNLVCLVVMALMTGKEL